MSGVVIRKKLPDIRLSDRPQQGVGEGVIDRITIGMPNGADWMVENDSGQDKGPPLACGCNWFEAMQVIAVTDPYWLGATRSATTAPNCS